MSLLASVHQLKPVRGHRAEDKKPVLGSAHDQTRPRATQQLRAAATNQEQQRSSTPAVHSDRLLRQADVKEILNQSRATKHSRSACASPEKPSRATLQPERSPGDVGEMPDGCPTDSSAALAAGSARSPSQPASRLVSTPLSRGAASGNPLVNSGSIRIPKTLGVRPLLSGVPAPKSPSVQPSAINSGMNSMGSAGSARTAVCAPSSPQGKPSAELTHRSKLAQYAHNSPLWPAKPQAVPNLGLNRGASTPDAGGGPNRLLSYIVERRPTSRASTARAGDDLAIASIGLSARQPSWSVQAPTEVLPCTSSPPQSPSRPGIGRLMMSTGSSARVRVSSPELMRGVAVPLVQIGSPSKDKAESQGSEAVNRMFSCQTEPCKLHLVERMMSAPLPTTLANFQREAVPLRVLHTLADSPDRSGGIASPIRQTASPERSGGIAKATREEHTTAVITVLMKEKFDDFRPPSPAPSLGSEHTHDPNPPSEGNPEYGAKDVAHESGHHRSVSESMTDGGPAEAAVLRFRLDQALAQVRHLESCIAEEQKRSRELQDLFSGELVAQRDSHARDVKAVEETVTRVEAENLRLRALVKRLGGDSLTETLPTTLLQPPDPTSSSSNDMTVREGKLLDLSVISCAEEKSFGYIENSLVCIGVEGAFAEVVAAAELEPSASTKYAAVD